MIWKLVKWLYLGKHNIDILKSDALFNNDITNEYKQMYKCKRKLVICS